MSRKGSRVNPQTELLIGDSTVERSTFLLVDVCDDDDETTRENVEISFFRL